MTEFAKVVFPFPRSLDMAARSRSRLARGNAAADVARLKELPARDLARFASARLTAKWRRSGLIDESRVLVAPVVLGARRPMFREVAARMPLRFVATTGFASGVAVLSYEPRDRKGE